MTGLPVERIGPASMPQATPKVGQKDVGGDFKEMLEGYLKEVNTLQHKADQAVNDLATGKTENLHELIAAVNEADLSFRLMMEMRNKLVDAYKEIMRMQV